MTPLAHVRALESTMREAGLPSPYRAGLVLRFASDRFVATARADGTWLLEDTRSPIFRREMARGIDDADISALVTHLWSAYGA